uniref:uncharacterized protein LOC122604521 n=1 Tax=Erigeron canadensis TaxID=72917 RepID=UPI001CB8CB3B|nr:uncharacterized protein LOC122604521 [Erigeron canadensis]
MDHSTSREQDINFDLESGTGAIHRNDEGCPDLSLDDKLAKTIFLKLCDGFTCVDDGSVKLHMNSINVDEGSPENTAKVLMDTNSKIKKATSAKKPPRPPGGFSLYASDKKLIKELAELAMIKRARIERMKALKQKKALKISSSPSSSSSSSHGSFFAMLFTIIFFLVICLQGRRSDVTIQGSHKIIQTNGGGLLAMQNQLSLTTSDFVSANSKSSTLF